MLEAAPLRPRRCAPSATFSSTLMVGSRLTCWNVRPMPRPAIAWAERPEIGSPLKAISPAVGCSTPVTRLKMVLLPAPLGPIRATISPARTPKLTSLTATSPPKVLRTPASDNRGVPAGGIARAGERLGRGRARRLGARRHQRRQARPQSLARGLQQQHQQGSEHDRLVVAFAAEQGRQDALQLVLEQRDDARAQDRPADVAGASSHGHQQVLDAGVDAERSLVHGALHVRVEPAGDARQQRRVDEHDELHARGADAEQLGGKRSATQRANGAPGARVEQVVRGNGRQQHARPDHVVDAAAVVEVPAGDVEWRDGRDAVVAMEQLELAEQEVQAQAPGDGAERQVVARQAHRRQAEQRARRVPVMASATGSVAQGDQP